MSRAWKLIFTALCLAPAVGLASEPGAQPKPTDAERLERLITERFNTLDRKLDDARNQMTAIQDSVVGIRRDIVALERRIGAVERDGMVRTEELQALKDQLDALRRDLDTVRRSESQLRESMKLSEPTRIPPTGTGDPAAPGMVTPRRLPTTTLRFNNESVFDHDVIVNGMRYLVPALSFVDVPAVAGPVSYYVVNDPLGTRTVTVPANRLHPVRIR